MFRNIRKTFFLLTMMLMAVLVTGINASAAAPAPIRSDGLPDPVVDYAGLLTDKEESSLRAQIDKVREAYAFDVVVVTVDTTGMLTPTEYADDFFLLNNYGLDEEKSGILLLVAINDRSWATCTHGEAIEYFTENVLYDMEDEFIPYMSDGDFAHAFRTYISITNHIVARARTEQAFTFVTFLICLLIGFLLALIPLFIQLHRMNNVHAAKDANPYHSSRGLQLKHSEDRYLRHTVSRVAIPKETRSGGGSITHTGHSGGTFGGHSGKF